MPRQLSAGNMAREKREAGSYAHNLDREACPGRGSIPGFCSRLDGRLMALGLEYQLSVAACCLECRREPELKLLWNGGDFQSIREKGSIVVRHGLG